MTQYKNQKFDIPGMSVHTYHTCFDVERDLPRQSINYTGPNLRSGKIKMKEIINIALVVVVLSSSGCSSIMNDNTQPVSVDTPNCPSATCKLTNSNGQYFVKKTPGTVMVNKAFGDLTVECSKGDVGSINVVKSSANATMFGNLLFGGIIGAALDGGSGVGFDYPEVIENGLSCAGK